MALQESLFQKLCHLFLIVKLDVKVPETVVVNEGSPIVINCTISGDETATIYSWTADDVTVEGQTSAMLTISSAQRNMTGRVYKCKPEVTSIQGISNGATVTVNCNSYFYHHVLFS